MSPSLRIIFALLGVTATALLLCAALVFGALDRLALRSSESNIEFLLSQLRDSVEANVGLGLPLANIRVVQNLVERAKAADERVLAVEVFSPTGISLFNTDRGIVGEDIPPTWHLAIRNRVVNDRWRVEELGAVVVGEVIRNDFGEPVGHLAMTISDEARQDHAETLLGALLARLGLIVPAVLVVVALAAYILFDRTTRDVAKLAARLRSDVPQVEGVPQETGLADRVRTKVDSAIRDFDRVAADVLKTDEA